MFVQRKRDTEMLKCVIVKPNQVAKITEIEDDLLAYQRVVDGFIEPIIVGRNLVALVNEDGYNLGMSPNFSIGYTTIVGPAIFLRDDGDVEYKSLTPKQIDEALNIIKEGRHCC